MQFTSMEVLFVLFPILILFDVVICSEQHVDPQDLHFHMSKRDLSRYFGVEEHHEVPEYDIVHPVQVDSDGEYLTHHLSRIFRRSTDEQTEHDVHYKVKAFDEDLHLSLNRNDHLLGPNLVSNVLGENGKILRSTIPKHCYYHGLAKHHETSKVALSNCQGLRGLIKTNKASYFIEPLPHHLKHKIKRDGIKQPHLIYKNHGYHGHKRTHWNGKIKEVPRVVNFCGTKDNTSIHIDPFSSDDETGSDRSIPDSSKGGCKATTLIIETYLVVDQKMTNFHGLDDVEQFALSAMNIGSKVLYDSSIGTSPVKVTLVKMSVLTTPQNGLNIVVHASDTLDSLGEWAAKENKADDDDPDHFDHAVLLTRYNICADKNEPCDTLGLAPVSGMCRFPVSVTVNQDNGLLVGMTVAHETGHNLGMNHDYIAGCKNGETVMSTSAPGKPTAFSWSACSRKYLETFCKLEQASCLNDEPQKRIKDFSQMEKPGILYDVNTQCATTFGSGSTFCDGGRYKKEICYKLWCKMPNNPLACSTVFEPAAEGTECDKNKWCEKGLCVEKGEEPPNAVDGGWSPWSDGSKCTRPCGGGIQEQLRACNSPQPQNGGKGCEGEGARYKTCNVKPCPQGTPSFLDKQCKEKNDILYGDQKFKWEWRPALDLSHPCELGCFIVNNNTGFELGPVIDGSDCNTTTNTAGKCVNRLCKEVGCDGILGSTAKLDRCGVCNGDGSTCEPNVKHSALTTGAKKFTWATKTLPCTVSCAGGVSVVVAECRRTDDNSIVGETFCNAGDRPPKKETPCNEQPCPATWLPGEWGQCTKTCNGGTHERTVKCTRLLKGNIEEDIEEEMCKKTGMIQPPTTEICNDFQCNAEWFAKDFAPCSTTCGPGFRQRAIVCIKPDRNGVNIEISADECKDLVQPFDSEKCNLDKPCPGGTCGGTFTNDNGAINSPGFPSDYPNDQECVYSITVQPGNKVKLSFNSFKIDTADEGDIEQECSGDHLEIFDSDCKETEKAAMTKYCGNTKPDAYISTTNNLCVKFISDAAKSATGFDANYKTCSGTCDVPPAVTDPPGGQPVSQPATVLRKLGQAVDQLGAQIAKPKLPTLPENIVTKGDGQPAHDVDTGPTLMIAPPNSHSKAGSSVHTSLHRQRVKASSADQRGTSSTLEEGNEMEDSDNEEEEEDENENYENEESDENEDNEEMDEIEDNDDNSSDDDHDRYYHDNDEDDQVDDDENDKDETSDEDEEDEETTETPVRSKIVIRTKKRHSKEPRKHYK